MKVFLAVIALTGILCNFCYADNWIRSDGNIFEKGWNRQKGPATYANLIDQPPPNQNSCSNSEDNPDKALKFDISDLKEQVSGQFDVNNIYVDGIEFGESALEALQLDFARRANHSYGELPYLLGKDWSEDDHVYVCVGTAVRALVNDSHFYGIILWYDIASSKDGPTKKSEIPNGFWAAIGNTAWLPYTVPCQDASVWKYKDTGAVIANSNTQSVNGYNVCSANNVLPECIESNPSSCGSQSVSTVHFSTGVDTTVTPDPDQGYIDPSDNHKHPIGMHSVRYRMLGQSSWHYGETSVNHGTNDKIDIRVKVKEKEGWDWKNVCVDLYLHFDTIKYVFL